MLAPALAASRLPRFTPTLKISPEPALALLGPLMLLLAAQASAAAAPACEAPTAASPPPTVSASGPSTRPSTGDGLQPSTVLGALPRPDAVRSLPIVLRARSLSAQVDRQTRAEGDVEFRRGGVVIRADELIYDAPSDEARVSGHVRISRDGAVYTGPALTLAVDRFVGSFTEPTFEFLRLGAGGQARRLDFLGPTRAVALDARYTSCPREGGAQLLPPMESQGPAGAAASTAPEPAWELRTQRVLFNIAENEGIAEGARLRFLGTTILALPTMSFPLTDARKSGWLPPSVDIDNRSGVELSMPYYWNIAPNLDMTLSPRLITRRGLGLNSELRYLQPGHEGTLALDGLPNDRVADRARYGVQWQHRSELPAGVQLQADWLRVSDDDWWKDFPKASRSLGSRLLPSRFALERPFELGAGSGAGLAGISGLAYARVSQWQVLQAADSFITAPYQRAPQVGLRLNAAQAGFEWGVETEFNRFTLPTGQVQATQRTEGDRWHLLGNVSHPWREPGWWVVPRLSVNAAAYRNSVGNGVGSGLGAALQPLGGASRVIPSFSVDAGLELERRTEAFGRALHQTLEPRLLYVNTPYRAQSQLPNYDAAAKDFNFVSLYSDNTFSGVDRVADAHQLTAGVATRLVDVSSGAEALRLGLVQRYLFRTQRVTAQADGTPDGAPLEQKFSDVLLLGSTSVLPGWTLDAAAQYSPELNSSVRTIVGARYSPGPFRTVSATYRLARGLSEQLELGWQWPVYGAGARWPGNVATAAPAADESPTRLGAALQSLSQKSGCSGTWYAVGRFNYSIKDQRITDSVLGAEYDAGCWIGRFVAERLSTGRAESTTRYKFQLELVGLSRLGSNPLKVLKDNIPGYQLLRESRSGNNGQSLDRSTLSPFYE